MTENHDTRPSGEPDEFDSLVLDEEFIRGGISEASLPGHQRALPESARPKRPSSPTPPVDDGSSAALPGSGFMRSTGLVLGVAVLVMVSVLLAGFLRVGSGTGNTGAGTQFANGAGATRDQYSVAAAELPPTTQIGTCFDIPPAQTGTKILSIITVPCSQAHEFELVAQIQSEGTNATYPDWPYWTQTIQPQCDKALQDYTGETLAAWPQSLNSRSLIPTKGGWAGGDRAVSCLADSNPDSNITVRQLATTK